MPPHPLTNFEIQQYYQNEHRFNGVYSRDNPPRIRYGAYIISLDDYCDIGTHWIALYVQNNDVTYFDSFGVEHIPKEVKTGKTLTDFTNLFSPNNFKKTNDIILNYFMTNV